MRQGQTFDVLKSPEAATAINETLNKGYIAEVKIEHGKIAVVEIKRTLKTKYERDA